MLCLVPDREWEDNVEPIGLAVARRLRAAMNAKGWTQGEVHIRVNTGRPAGEDALSLKTVGALLRGAQVNPSFGTVLAVAQALGLDLNQVAGISPMPEAVSVPNEDAMESRVERLEERLGDQGARLDRIASVLNQVLDRLEVRSEAVGAEAGEAPRTGPELAPVSTLERKRRRPGAGGHEKAE